MTFEAGTTPDWAAVRSLFIEEAVVVLRTGREQMSVFSLDGFVNDFVQFIEQADVELVSAALKHPLREPAYRRQRPHHQFLASIGPIDAARLETGVRRQLEHLTAACATTLGARP